MFANSGFRVIGFDTDPKVIAAVSAGSVRTREPGLENLLKKVVNEGSLEATIDANEAFEDSDVYIVCVDVPLNKAGQPCLSQIRTVCKEIASSPLKEKLVIIESTVPPRTTKDVVAKILEVESRFECGRDLWLAHCPERMSTGNAIRDFAQNVRIVGGHDENSTKIALALFKAVAEGEILTTDCTTAEVAKLAENSFRDVNIAFANELALICEEIGIDVAHVAELANTHPRVKIHAPGYVGGPCVPKATHLLLHGVKDKEKKLKLMLSSRELNEYMLEHTINLIISSLKEVGKKVGTSRIAVLGAAYKGETDDARNSSSEKIAKKLMKLGAKVVVYDPYAIESFGALKAPNIMKAAEDADCLVIATAHEMFRKLEFKEIRRIMMNKPIIVDGRQLIDPSKVRGLGFHYVGIGNPHC